MRLKENIRLGSFELAERHVVIILLSCIINLLILGACATKQPSLGSQNSSVTNAPAQTCEEWEQAQVSNQGLGRDLVYEATLQSNNYGSDAPMWKWIHQNGERPPINKLVAEWQGEPIISSILIEVVGPEGSPGGFWYIRTMSHLYRWDFDKGKFYAKKIELTSLQEYDKAFAEMACWQQAAPVRTDTLFDGYYGFLSLYREGKSRQMLLTFRDFFEIDPRDDEKNLKEPHYWGRLWKALAPVLAATLR